MDDLDYAMRIEIKRKVRLYLEPEDWGLVEPDDEEEYEKQGKAIKAMNWRIAKAIKSDMSDDDCWTACVNVLHDPQFAKYGTMHHQPLHVLMSIIKRCKRD